MTWTHTSRGRALDLLDPQPGDIDLEEIGHALGRQCRYAGCIRDFYSVAEHSVLISQWLQEEGESVEVQLGGLLHDAAEAYTGDLTWPMQAVLWGDDEAGRTVRERYQRVQYALDALIAAEAGISPTRLHCSAVKEADLRILLDERRALLTEPPPRPWHSEAVLRLRPLGVHIAGLAPWVATSEWLARLRELQGRL